MKRSYFAGSWKTALLQTKSATESALTVREDTKETYRSSTPLLHKERSSGGAREGVRDINMIKTKKKSVSKLKKELDGIFSKYIRARDGHKCYTCNRQMEANQSQCGHFVPRQYLATRYDEINCHAQCYACNMLYNGQPSAYAARLENDYGAGTVVGLESLRHTVVKNFDYAGMIQLYSLKLTEEK